MVTHRHIGSAEVDEALSRVASVVKKMQAAHRGPTI
jgi:hypothetical protein